MSYKRNSPIIVAEGGTGAQTLTAHGVLVGEGTSAITPITVGTDGQVLVGKSANDPSFISPTAGTGLTGTFNSTTFSYALSTPISVANGGTGVTSNTAYALLCGGITTTNPIQSIASVGTSGQLLTSNGASALPTFQTSTRFNSVVIQSFTASGTYTPTTNMQYCIIELVGGGGGGGGSTSTSSTTVSAAGGGAGGGYARLFASAATIGASQTVTVGSGGTAGAVAGGTGGTGGTSSVGTLISASGGGGGVGATTGGLSAALGGTAGNGTIGTVQSYGQCGFNGFGIYISGSSYYAVGGQGGNSVLGGGAKSSSSGAGINGQGYGGGASGASLGISGTQGTGGVGAAGIVIITEYIS